MPFRPRRRYVHAPCSRTSSIARSGSRPQPPAARAAPRSSIGLASACGGASFCLRLMGLEDDWSLRALVAEPAVQRLVDELRAEKAFEIVADFVKRWHGLVLLLPLFDLLRVEILK